LQNETAAFAYLATEFCCPTRNLGEFVCLIFPFIRSQLSATLAHEMTALDDIKELGRETSAFNRKLVRALIDEERGDRMAERISALRDSLLGSPGEMIAFYKVTDVLTRRMTTADAVTVWKKTRRLLLAMKREWESVEKFGEPEIDGIVAYYCKVLDDLATKAGREYRSYAETAHLLSSPANASRLADALYETATGRAQEMTLAELAMHSGVR
jgi:hypothetical protein